MPSCALAFLPCPPPTPPPTPKILPQNVVRVCVSFTSHVCVASLLPHISSWSGFVVVLCPFLFFFNTHTHTAPGQPHTTSTLVSCRVCVCVCLARHGFCAPAGLGIRGEEEVIMTGSHEWLSTQQQPPHTSSSAPSF